ncbi:MAG TPA: hypothetical protein VH518_04800 [Tepidisphaeraceae bacterium]
MTLSKREKVIGIAVGAVVGLFALDRLAVSPLMAEREDLLTQIESAENSRNQAKSLIQSKPVLDRQLADIVSRGLTQDQSQAESQLLNNLREWGQEAGLDIATLKPSGAPLAVIKPGGKPNEKEKAFLRITCRATGTGGMQQVGRFIFRIQTSSIPVRITDLSINSRKEGTDDLELNLGLSTIFLAPDAAKEIGPEIMASAGASSGSQLPPAAIAATRASSTTGPSTRAERRQ